MSRIRPLGPRDADREPAGDRFFLGVDMKTKPWNLPEGIGQEAINKRFGSGAAATRPGTTMPKFANIISYGTIYGSGIYSNPNDSNAEWMMLAVSDGVWFCRDGRYPTKVSLASGLSITGTVEFVQCFNVIVMLRGTSLVPLVWTGDFYGTFTAITATSSGNYTSPIPNAIIGTLFRDRLLVKKSRDEIAVSDVGVYTRYDAALQEFKINQGSDDEISSIFPLGETSILVFKDQSIFGVDNIYGNLSAIRGREVSREGIGAIATHGVQKWGDKVSFFSSTGIWLVEPVQDQNGIRLAISEAPLSDALEPIINRINFRYASGIVSESFGNYIYWAIPMDGSTYNNAVIVFNRTTKLWEGYDTWNSASGFRIDRFHVTDWMGTKKLFAVDRGNARVYLMYEGASDVVGATEYQISDSFHSRAFILSQMGFSALQKTVVTLATQNPSFTVTAVTDGVSEEKTLVSARTKDRTKYYLHGKADYDLTNANNDHAAALRKDYWVKSSDGALSNGNINPNLKQQCDEPFPIHTKARYCSIKIANIQGLCDVSAITLEGVPAEQRKLAA